MTTKNINDSIEFSKTKSGCKYIQTLTLETLIPPKLIQENNLTNFSTTTEVPIFFNVSSETFGFFLPENFFTDIHYKEYNFHSTSGAKPYKDKKISYDSFENIFFSFDSIKELMTSYNSNDSAFVKFKEIYENHFFNIQKGEEVIIISFLTTKNNSSLGELKRDFIFKDKEIFDIPEGITAKFEFFKAIKFQNTYYLVDENNKINQDTCYRFDKNNNQNTLVIPYSEDDWQIIKKLRNKMMDIQSDIKNLFEEHKTTEKLDNPFKKEFILPNLHKPKN